MSQEQQLDRISELFQRESAALRRRTLWLSLIPVVVGVVVIVTAYQGVRQARARKAVLLADIEELEAKRDQLAEEAEQQRAVASFLKQKLPEPERRSADLVQTGLDAFNKGEYEQAVRQLKAAAESEPQLAEVRYRLGLSLWRTGDEKAAIEQILKAFELDESYEKRARANPKLKELLTYSQIVEAEKSDSARTEVDRNAAELVKEALASTGRGAYDKAVDSYRKALEVNPDNAKVHGLRGYALYKEGEYDRAIDSLKSCLELDARSAECHYTLGLALWQKGDRRSALAALEKSFALDPKVKELALLDPAYRRIQRETRLPEKKIEPRRRTRPG